MALSRRTGRSRLTLALLVLTSIALLTLDFRDAGPVESARRVASSAMEPVVGAFSTVTDPIADAWSGMWSYGDVRDENERLRARIAELEGDNLRQEDAEQQLRELMDQQGMTWVGDIPTTAARVVSGPASNFAHTIEIDKGTSDGVHEGMPVVDGAGLVGKVVQATGDRATVQLVVDPDFAVGVRLVRDGAPGTARGQGFGEPLIVDTGLEADATVRRGATLTTSGADRSAFPASIPVGRVTSTRASGGGLTLDLIVEPAAETERLSFVTVMLWEPEGAQP